MATTLTRASIDQFHEYIVERGRSQNTARAYRADLTGLLETVGERDPQELEQAAAEYLTAGRGQWKPTTLNRKVAAFRTWARWAGYGDDFLSDYGTPKPAKPRPHPLPGGMDTVKAMLAVVPSTRPDLGALVVLTGMMGLRVSEVRGVRVCDVDADDLMVYVRGKGDKHREVPIPEPAIGPIFAAVGMARARATGDPAEERLVPFSDRWVREQWGTLTRRVTGVRRGTHDGRATAATHWHSVTKDLRATQELLGHSRSATTEIYTDVDRETLRRTVNSVALPAGSLS